MLAKLEQIPLGDQRNLGDLGSHPECARLQTRCRFFVAVIMDYYR